ncbi:MAG: 30S ribosomal protein S12 methylthiotransferase RimO [Bdellovibrionota bacterium]
MYKEFSVITLGCAKNEVDTEFIIGIMKEAGFEYKEDLESANIIIINSCAFLESSVNESIDAVLSVSGLKKSAKLKTLVLTGCLVHRYKMDLFKELPEVDIFLSTEKISKLPSLLKENKKGVIFKNFETFLGDEKLPRVITKPLSFAYIKIAEGCNHKCAYCTIPAIKGKLRSRSILSIVKEARKLVNKGVREINLIAQDLSSYGSDLNDGTNLNLLIDALHEENFRCKFRVLYLYPTGINDGLLKRLSTYDDFCSYIDLPLQHSSESVLKAMLRPVGKFSSKNIVEKIKTKYPQIAIRTTFIVGFPNESKEDVKDLEEFVSKGYFSSMGVFAYSFEEGSVAFENFPNFKLDKKRVKKDKKAVEIAWQKTRLKELKALKGKTLKILLEGYHSETDMILVGRTEFQAPEVDGKVLITEALLDKEDIKFGEFYTVKVKNNIGFDLEACLLSRCE